MKKQFFYVAMALAMLSSCSKDNDPGVVPNPDEGNNDDKVAIELGVSTPDISATTRGTGTVGSDNEATNQWNSQRLYIYMIDTKTGGEAIEPKTEGSTDPDVKILPNDGANALTFIAPAGKSSTNSGSIRIYETYNEENDNGTIQYKYYPVSGKYTFFGFHVDDASVTYTPDGTTGEMTPGTPTWIPTFTADKKAVENITIDGTQDILGAETVQLTGDAKPATGDYADAKLIGGATWADMVSNQFGAKTARNGIKPILKFDHQLARLKFYLRAGNEQAAVNMWDKNAWVKRNAPTFTDGKPADESTFTSESGVYITRISALNMTNIINLDFTNGVKASRNTTAQATKFNLMSTPESGKNLVALTPVAPEYPATLPEGATAPAKPEGAPDDFYTYTAIGESMMFFPDSETIGTATTATDTEIKFELDLGQVRIDTEDETQTPHAFTYKWIEKPNTVLALSASKVGEGAKFEAGKSYNVYITIYGFERIDITAQLTAWGDGGDIETDIEDGK